MRRALGAAGRAPPPPARAPARGLVPLERVFSALPMKQPVLSSGSVFTSPRCCWCPHRANPVYSYSEDSPVGCLKCRLHTGRESRVLLRCPRLATEFQAQRYLLWRIKSLLHLVTRAQSGDFCCGTFAQRQETGQISPHAAVWELGCPEGSAVALERERSCSKPRQFDPKSCNFLLSGHSRGGQEKQKLCWSWAVVLNANSHRFGARLLWCRSRAMTCDAPLQNDSFLNQSPGAAAGFATGHSCEPPAPTPAGPRPCSRGSAQSPVSSH